MSNQFIKKVLSGTSSGIVQSPQGCSCVVVIKEQCCALARQKCFSPLFLNFLDPRKSLRVKEKTVAIMNWFYELVYF